MLLFGNFQQDNYKIQFLLRGLGTRLRFELFISFHPNSLIPNILRKQLLEAIAVQLLILYPVNVLLVVTAFS